METLVPNWTLDDDDKDIKEYFRKKKMAYTEDTMIEKLKNQNNKYEIRQAILALRKIGTIKSVEYLKNIVHYKNMDVQGAVACEPVLKSV